MLSPTLIDFHQPGGSDHRWKHRWALYLRPHRGECHRDWFGDRQPGRRTLGGFLLQKKWKTRHFFLAKKSPLTQKGNHGVKVVLRHLVENYMMACACIYSMLLCIYVKCIHQQVLSTLCKFRDVSSLYVYINIFNMIQSYGTSVYLFFFRMSIGIPWFASVKSSKNSVEKSCLICDTLFNVAYLRPLNCETMRVVSLLEHVDTTEVAGKWEMFRLQT